MSNIKENYLQILETIQKTATSCGRDKENITLVAVSKNQTIENVLRAYDAGCRNFGENRLEEAFSKISALPDDINWHFIGSLQKNKIRKVVDRFALIHSIDSFELAEKISSVSVEKGCITSILLQVNVSGELSKHGFSRDELLENFNKLLNLPNLKIEGLMTMAPLIEDENIIRRCFSGLRLLLEKLNEDLPQECKLKILSMGMSHDYKLAIEEGATHLRIGSSLFK